MTVCPLSQLGIIEWLSADYKPDTLPLPFSRLQARQMFDKICPGEEFLPKAPNPEDIIWDEGDQETGEGFQSTENDDKDKDKETTSDTTEKNAKHTVEDTVEKGSGDTAEQKTDNAGNKVSNEDDKQRAVKKEEEDVSASGDNAAAAAHTES